MSGFFACPPFTLSKTRYDMETYTGRLWHFYRSIQPTLMFETAGTLAAHQKKLDDFAAGKLDRSKPQNDDSHLWYSRCAIESCVHPTTKEVIPMPCRMAAYVPGNFIIVPVMVLPSTIASTARTVGIHWANQSYNSVVNYANRSSDALPMQTLLQAYVAAVVVSCSGALGATFLLRRMTDTTSARATIVRATLPFAAVAFSGGANVAMMRREEWATKGVPVRNAADLDGDVLGYSLAAGKVGILKCAAARFLWNIPPMVLPPLAMVGVRRTAWAKRASEAAIRRLEIFMVCSMLVFGVAPALAAFKPNDLIVAETLEPQFHNMKDKEGKPIRIFTYYKGL